MNLGILLGIILPFLGTALGAAAVFITPKNTLLGKNGSLSGFAAGVMMAASVWSLIIPAVEMSSKLGFFAFLPMLFGLWLGVFFLIVSEKLFSAVTGNKIESLEIFIFAVVLHNIPEGMAVGVALACALKANSLPLLASALILSLGISLQNIPEGTIISSPLASLGASKKDAFAKGALSGIVEPIAAILALIFSSAVSALLPYLLGFAAGAMIYVSVKELLPDAATKTGLLSFFAGFSVMMVLDIALG